MSKGQFRLIESGTIVGPENHIYIATGDNVKESPVKSGDSIGIDAYERFFKEFFVKGRKRVDLKIARYPDWGKVEYTKVGEVTNALIDEVGDVIIEVDVKDMDKICQLVYGCNDPTETSVAYPCKCSMGTTIHFGEHIPLESLETNTDLSVELMGKRYICEIDSFVIARRLECEVSRLVGLVEKIVSLYGNPEEEEYRSRILTRVNETIKEELLGSNPSDKNKYRRVVYTKNPS